jgi:hypothetical protein
VRRRILFIVASVVVSLIGCDPLFAAARPAGILRFAASLCGTGASADQRITAATAVCTGSGLTVRLSLVDRADLVLGGKKRTKEQLQSCVFELQRTQTTSPGVTSDADYYGVASRLAFRDLNSRSGQVVLFSVLVLLPDKAAEAKGAAAIGELRRVLQEFDAGATHFFAKEDYLRPIDCQ